MYCSSVIYARRCKIVTWVIGPIVLMGMCTICEIKHRLRPRSAKTNSQNIVYMHSQQCINMDCFKYNSSLKCKKVFCFHKVPNDIYIYINIKFHNDFHCLIPFCSIKILDKNEWTFHLCWCILKIIMMIFWILFNVQFELCWISVMTDYLKNKINSIKGSYKLIKKN